MDARQLRYFLAVVDHEGVNRAAEALLIAQPSLSHTIATLERELGVLLFHRIGRRLTLSVAGETLIGPARTVLRNLEDAKASVAALKELRAGRIEMITMPSYGIEPLSTILTAFADKHPAVTFKVETAPNPAAVVSAVRTGVSEIGLLGASGPVREPELDVVELEVQPLVLISGPGTAVPDGQIIKRSEMAGMRLIVSQGGSLMRSLVDDVLASGVAATIVAEMSNRTSILPLVLKDFGQAVLPAAWAPLARRSGAQVRRIVPESSLHVVAICRRSQLTPPAAALMAEMRSYPSWARMQWEE